MILSLWPCTPDGAPKAAGEKELKSFATWIKERWDSDNVFDDDLILVGDFNIPKIGDKYYKALTEESKLKIPASLVGVKDTAASPGNKRCNLILRRSHEDFPIGFSDKGGVIDFCKRGSDGKIVSRFPQGQTDLGTE